MHRGSTLIDEASLKKYILTICIPTVKYLAGYTTISFEDIIVCIKSNLIDKKIEFIFSERLALKRNIAILEGDCKIVSENQPCFYFHQKGRIFAIYLKNTSIRLAELNSDFIIQYEYPWYTFCPVYKKGEDYVKTTISNFLEFIETLPE